MIVLVCMLALVLAAALPAFAQPDKVTICHKPGTPAEKTLRVPPQAVPGHLNHGDTRGPCDGDNGGGGGGNNGGGGGGGGNNGGGGGDGAGGDGAVITQESEQEVESGEVDQSFTVTSEGDNSSQCVGFSGVAQTGNAQNQIDVLQYGSESGDFEFDEVGSDLSVSPENSTECDQQVNQAASASGS